MPTLEMIFQSSRTECMGECRENVVAAARQGEEGIAQIAKDLGIAKSCLRDWLSAADAEDGKRSGPKGRGV
jgi:transposase-like protein